MQSPKLKTLQLYITRRDAENFHKKFYTPRTLAQARKRSWQAVTAELKAVGVKAFSPDGEDYGNLFEGSAVDAILK
jgi:hypothetical protein